MTNEIEKQFFDTFGIEPIKKQESELVAIGENIRGLKRVEKHFYEYPQITDRILLELICIKGGIYVCTQDRETLKEHILIQCMNTQMYSRDIKHQVRTLFEEG